MIVKFLCSVADLVILVWVHQFHVKNTVFLKRQNQSRQEILMCIYASNNFDLLFFIENKWVNDHFAMVAEYVATKSIKIEPAAII